MRSTTGAVAASVGARVAALVKRFEEQRVGPLVHRLEGDMESIDNEEALRDLSDIGRQVAEVRKRSPAANASPGSNKNPLLVAG